MRIEFFENDDKTRTGRFTGYGFPDTRHCEACGGDGFHTLHCPTLTIEDLREALLKIAKKGEFEANMRKHFYNRAIEWELKWNQVKKENNALRRRGFAVDALDMLAEVWVAHRDVDCIEYNGCEDQRCTWCEKTMEIARKELVPFVDFNACIYTSLLRKLFIPGKI